MLQIVRKIVGLTEKYLTEERIMIQKMHVKSVFRTVGMDPAGAVNFGYVVRDYLSVDVRFKFG